MADAEDRFSSGILLENIGNDFCLLRHNGKAFAQIAVAEGRARLIFAQSGFPRHAFFDLLGKVQRVIFRHCFEHTFINDGKFIILRDRLFYGNDAHAVFFQQGFIKHSVLPAAGKAVKFMDEYGFDLVGFFSCLTDHTLESRAFFRAPAGNAFISKYKFIGDGKAVLSGESKNFFQLCGGGIFGLVFCGNADIGGGNGHGAGSFVRLHYQDIWRQEVL